MTFTPQIERIPASGDGIVTQFSFSPMVFLTAEDVEVTVIPPAGEDIGERNAVLILDTDYRITGSGSSGSVTFPITGGPTPSLWTEPLAVGWKLYIRVKPHLRQTLSLSPQSSWNPNLLEALLDRAFMALQRLRWDHALSLRLPHTLSDQNIDTTLPAPEPGRIGGGVWNATARALEPGPAVADFAAASDAVGITLGYRDEAADHAAAAGASAGASAASASLSLNAKMQAVTAREGSETARDDAEAARDETTVQITEAIGTAADNAAEQTRANIEENLQGAIVTNGLGRSHVGELMLWGGLMGDIPDGWLILNGQSVAIASYPQLHAFVDDADMWGTGTTNFRRYSFSPTTFQLPQVDSKFLRATTSTGRAVWSNQNDSFESHTHNYLARPATIRAVTDSTIDVNSVSSEGTTATTSLAGSGDETRPENVAVVVAIRAIGVLANAQELANLPTLREAIDDLVRSAGIPLQGLQRVSHLTDESVPSDFGGALLVLLPHNLHSTYSVGYSATLTPGAGSGDFFGYSDGTDDSTTDDGTPVGSLAFDADHGIPDNVLFSWIGSNDGGHPSSWFPAYVVSPHADFARQWPYIQIAPDTPNAPATLYELGPFLVRNGRYEFPIENSPQGTGPIRVNFKSSNAADAHFLFGTDRVTDKKAGVYEWVPDDTLTAGGIYKPLSGGGEAIADLNDIRDETVGGTTAKALNEWGDDKYQGATLDVAGVPEGFVRHTTRPVAYFQNHAKAVADLTIEPLRNQPFGAVGGVGYGMRVGHFLGDQVSVAGIGAHPLDLVGSEGQTAQLHGGDGVGGVGFYYWLAIDRWAVTGPVGLAANAGNFVFAVDKVGVIRCWNHLGVRQEFYKASDMNSISTASRVGEFYLGMKGQLDRYVGQSAAEAIYRAEGGVSPHHRPHVGFNLNNTDTKTISLAYLDSENGTTELRIKRLPWTSLGDDGRIYITDPIGLRPPTGTESIRDAHGGLTLDHASDTSVPYHHAYDEKIVAVHDNFDWDAPAEQSVRVLERNGLVHEYGYPIVADPEGAPPSRLTRNAAATWNTGQYIPDSAYPYLYMDDRNIHLKIGGYVHSLEKPTSLLATDTPGAILFGHLVVRLELYHYGPSAPSGLGISPSNPAGIYTGQSIEEWDAANPSWYRSREDALAARNDDTDVLWRAHKNVYREFDENDNIINWDNSDTWVLETVVAIQYSADGSLNSIREDGVYQSGDWQRHMGQDGVWGEWFETVNAEFRRIANLTPYKNGSWGDSYQRSIARADMSRVSAIVLKVRPFGGWVDNNRAFFFGWHEKRIERPVGGWPTLRDTGAPPADPVEGSFFMRYVRDVGLALERAGPDDIPHIPDHYGPSVKFTVDPNSDDPGDSAYQQVSSSFGLRFEMIRDETTGDLVAYDGEINAMTFSHFTGTNDRNEFMLSVKEDRRA